jgi:lipoprotein signal peptidase
MRNKARNGLILGLTLGVLLGVGAWQRGNGVLNQGGILGLFAGAWWWSFLVWVVLGYLSWWWWRTEAFRNTLTLTVILAGGLANAIERLIYGGVVDYIYYPFWGIYGNLADILLGAGAVWWLFRSFTKTSR